MSLDGLKNLLKRAKDEKAEKQTLFARTDLNHSSRTSASSPFSASTVHPPHHEDSPVTENSVAAPFAPVALSQDSQGTKCGEAPLLNGKTMTSSANPEEDHLLKRKRVRPSSSFQSSPTEHISAVESQHDNSSPTAAMTTKAETTPTLSTEEVRKEKKEIEPLRKREKEEEEWHSREEINSFRKAALKGLETTMNELAKSWERLPCGRSKKRNYRIFPSSMSPSSSKDAVGNVNVSFDDAGSRNQSTPALWNVLPQPVCKYLEELLEVEFRLPSLKYEEDMRRDNSLQERLFFVSRSTPTTATSLSTEELLLRALHNRSESSNGEEQLISATRDYQQRHQTSIDDEDKILRGGTKDADEEMGTGLPLKDGNNGPGYSAGFRSIPSPVHDECARWRRCAALLQCMWFLLAAQWRDALRGKGLSSSFLSSPITNGGGTSAKGQYGRSSLLVVDSVGDRIEGWSFVVYRFLQFQKGLHLHQDVKPHAGELSSSSKALFFHPQKLLAEEEKTDERDNVIRMEELTSIPVRQAAEQWLEEKRWRQRAFRLLALVFHDFKKIESEFLQRFNNTPPLLLATEISVKMNTGHHPSCATNRTAIMDTSTDLHTIPNSSSDIHGSRHHGTSSFQESSTGEGKVCIPSSIGGSGSSSIKEEYVVPASVLDGLYRILVVHLQKQSVEVTTAFEEEEENKNAQEKEVNTTRLGYSSSSCFTTSRSITSLSHASSAPEAKNSLVTLVTAARQTYNDLTLGNANWKLGLFSGGEVHMRRSMEKVERHHVSHLLNNEKALSLLHVVYLWILFYEKGLSEKLRKSYCSK